MVRVALASALAFAMAVGTAVAGPVATLSDISGSVLVDSGKGFQKVSSAAEVQPGSRVLVSKNSKATIAYAAGCSKALSGNSITTVAGADACSSSAQVAAQQSSGRFCQTAKQDANGQWVCVALFGGGTLAVGALVGYAIGNGNTEIRYVGISG
ncbi:MAG: hypothetical protein J0I45_10965 [Bosea sp.]|nr:hypothetical protein [Bosea sp. (in: a-proteobacteria)]